MASVKVRNLGPFDRDLRDVGAVVPVGGVVEVGKDVAGAAPGKWERHADDEGNLLPEIADDGREYRAIEGGFEVREPGTGLLAQVDAWELVTDKPAPAEKKEG